jgi:dihydrodipicolinate synthase/N-acetylneuraminate lyase
VTALPNIVVPLIAAFTDDTSTLSEVRVSRVVRFHLERGAKGFVVCGETGDPYLLAHSERKQLLEWVSRESHGLPIWVNVTAMTTAGAVDLCQHASRHGAKGAVVCPPPVGRFFSNEAKAMLTSVQRHGNLATVFADPEGKWSSVLEEGGSPVSLASAVDPAWAVLDRPSPDEMNAGGYVVTPFSMFGADKVPKILEKLEVFRPALQSLIRHGGLNRAARAAMAELGCDVGTSRSPVHDLNDDGRKMLAGILTALKA